jgi:hypothetical protein
MSLCRARHCRAMAEYTSAACTGDTLSASLNSRQTNWRPFNCSGPRTHKRGAKGGTLPGCSKVALGGQGVSWGHHIHIRTHVQQHTHLCGTYAHMYNNTLTCVGRDGSATVPTTSARTSDQPEQCRVSPGPNLISLARAASRTCPHNQQQGARTISSKVGREWARSGPVFPPAPSPHHNTTHLLRVTQLQLCSHHADVLI